MAKTYLAAQLVPLSVDFWKRQNTMLQGKMFAIIVIAVAGALGGGIATFAIGFPSSPCEGVTGAIRHFTIIADVNGFNDSSHHPGSWPIMNVDKCDQVSITVVNKDIQAHGFAIDYYAVKGADVPGLQSYLYPTFLASKPGPFRVYCISQCTIHSLMQNGLLNVV